MRNVDFRAPASFQLHHDQILKLLKPLYGLTYACDYWHHPLTRHLREYLTMVPTMGDLSMFTKLLQHMLLLVTSSYVDDTLSNGDKEFEKVSRVTE